jgi:hypothetical protein
MTFNDSKIASLPRPIRDQLNRRIADGLPTADTLAWLNSLPDVQALIPTRFGGHPISQQNYSDWLRTGFRDWQTKQTARQFLDNFEPDDAALQESISGTLTQKLAYWIAIRYAAAAQTLSAAANANADSDPDQDPQTELRQLRELCQDIVTLRRGDLSAGRLAVEQQRVSLETAKITDLKEEEFWQWTKRPDIQAKLYPHRDPDQLRHDVETMINRRLLGLRPPSSARLDPDPAAMI